MDFPEHDEMIKTVQRAVEEAFSWQTHDEIRMTLSKHKVSFGTLMKLRSWHEHKGMSFRLDALLNAYSWAKDYSKPANLGNAKPGRPDLYSK